VSYESDDFGFGVASGFAAGFSELLVLPSDEDDAPESLSFVPFREPRP